MIVQQILHAKSEYRGGFTPLFNQYPHGLGKVASHKQVFTRLFTITAKQTFRVSNIYIPGQQGISRRKFLRYCPPRNNPYLFRHIIIPAKNVARNGPCGYR
ncbi:hypothetical protein HanPI659440_Chr12g0451081 [Helianthus annuus]|nr:hypothetical protein HanPI659440_Chr12g0451081 [Helianthus annuus]